MPSVVLQILFFLVVGVCVLGILTFFSAGEKEADTSDSSAQEKSATRSNRMPNFQGILSVFLDLPKKSSQILRNSTKQPRDIFVHTREILGRVRGQEQPSVLDRTFERDPEKSFFLKDMRPSASSTDVSPRRIAVKVKQAPKIAQKIQDQFIERSQEEKKEAENEEEFWIGILRQNPHSAHPYKKLGEIYLKRGEYKEAQASLSFALTKDPNDQEAAILLAEAKEKRSVKKLAV